MIDIVELERLCGVISKSVINDDKASQEVKKAVATVLTNLVLDVHRIADAITELAKNSR